MPQTQTPRGIRNNNPGNIRHGQQWQGLSRTQSDKDFCTFLTPQWGIRAMFKILQTYQSKYNALTIREMISRWAPPNENDTEAYIKAVADWVGVSPDAPMHLDKRAGFSVRLIEAIIRHENGQQPFDHAEIASGLLMA